MILLRGNIIGRPLAILANEVLNGVKNNGRCLTTVRRSLALV